MLRISVLTGIIILSTSLAFGQTRATQELHEKYDGAFTMFFYKSTLKMMTPEDNQEFRELIGGIEKAKLLRVNKSNGFEEEDVENYIGEIKRQAYEEAMTIRHDGNNMNIFVKENNGKTEGVILFMNSENDLSILDIIGNIDLGKITQLTRQIDF